jgi:hypothetical protein
MGIRFGLYLYDLLPITNPEFFEPELVETFTCAVTDMLMLSDFLLTISEYTGQQARLFAKERFSRDIPVRVIKNAHTLNADEPEGVTRVDVQKICQSRFVLCVGTIEVRKNHAYLIELWKELVYERGAAAVPDLVIVGRWGWKVEKLRDELTASDFIGGKIIVLAGVGDADLSLLYRHAMFTVYPSLAEGWGLPIGESLSHGTPCIASNTTAMPEVGGSFVVYFDPHSTQSGKDAIAKALDDPMMLDALATRVKAEFVPRSWSDVSQDLEVTLVELSAIREVHDTYVQLELGRIYRQGRLSSNQRMPPFHQNPIALLQVSGWQRFGQEEGWAAQRQSVIRFHVDGVNTFDRLRVAVRLELPPSQDTAKVRAIVGGAAVEFNVIGVAPRWYFFNALVHEAGKVEVCFVIDGPVFQADPKIPRFFRMTGICVMCLANIQQRLEVIEILSQECTRTVIT